MTKRTWWPGRPTYTLPGMSRGPALLLSAALLSGLVLAGCGDDEAGTAPTALLASPSTTATQAPAGVVVTGAWVRATTGSKTPSMTGAFMTLHNTGDTEVVLQRARSAVARMTQLHEMSMVDGKAAMHEVAGGIRVPAGGTVVLQPGGYHVMLMKLARPLAAGDEVTLSLLFSDGTTQTVTAPVKVFAEETGGYSPTPTSMPAH